jgi:hypothetical protein
VENFTSTGIGSPNHLAPRESLYRLGYPGLLCTELHPTENVKCCRHKGRSVRFKTSLRYESSAPNVMPCSLVEIYDVFISEDERSNFI